MSFEAVLDGLNQGRAVEVIHLLSRHLVELRSKAALREIIAIDAPEDPDVEAAIMGLVDEIERREGASLEAISPKARVGYLNDLSVQLRKKLDTTIGARDISATLEKLRHVS